jgi:anti-anti-sigma factor
LTGDSDLTDYSMLELFRAEVETHVPVLSEGLLALEKDPTQTKRLEALMRAAHSIKGASRIVGVDAAVQVAHVMEDYFVAAQRNEVTLTSDAIDRLLRGLDVLSQIGQQAGPELMDWLAANETKLQRAIEYLGGLRGGGTATPAPQPAPAPPPTPPPSSPRPAETSSGPLSPPAELDARAAEDLRRQLLDRLNRGENAVRLDLSRVRDIDPTGLGMLVVLARMVDGSNSPTVEVVKASPQVRTLFRLTRLEDSLRLPDLSAGESAAGERS